MKKGFTLMELLAVIVILSLLLIIVVPSLLDAINSKRAETFLMNSKLILQTINIHDDDIPNFDATTINVSNMKTILGLSDSNYLSITPEYINNNIFMTIIGKDEWQKYKACGYVYNMEIVSLSDSTRCNELKADSELVIRPNAPELATGMTPVKYKNNYWVVTNEMDLEWYNYDEKIWANAITEDGSLWVWIPRYAYRIASGYHTSTAGTIHIKFLKNNSNISVDGTPIALTPTYNGSSQTNYVSHPAFKFGNRELKGIWVAKFEATAGAGSCYASQNVANCNVITYSPMSKPNAHSWRYISAKNAHIVSTKMKDPGNIYGFYSGNVDTHVMKNIEWGAVAYLSKSVYGVNTNEVYINPANNYMTGCAGTSASSSTTTGCTYEYNTSNGVKASTTGNIYGVYDMSGGSFERTMGNLNYVQGTSYPFDLHSIDGKYVDIYTAYNSDVFGDAVYETSLGSVYDCSSWNGSTIGAWFGDQSNMPHECPNPKPYFIRGELYSNGSRAGLFAYRMIDDSPDQYTTFRPVVILTTN